MAHRRGRSPRGNDAYNPHNTTPLLPLGLVQVHTDFATDETHVALPLRAKGSDIDLKATITTTITAGDSAPDDFIAAHVDDETTATRRYEIRGGVVQRVDEEDETQQQQQQQKDRNLYYPGYDDGRSTSPLDSTTTSSSGSAKRLNRKPSRLRYPQHLHPSFTKFMTLHSTDGRHTRDPATTHMTSAGVWRPTTTAYAPRGAGPGGTPHINTYGTGPAVMVNADGVSPPSSPELNPGDGRWLDENDVSPIDETPDVSQLEIAQKHYQLYMEAQERQDLEHRDQRYREMLQKKQRERLKASDGDEQQQPKQASRAPKSQRIDQPTSPRQRSNIPMLRRERRRNQDGTTARPRRPSQASATSDPASESPGRAGSRMGSAHASELVSEPPAALTPPKHHHKQQRTFGDRIQENTVRPIRSPASTGTSPLSSSIDNRPGWRGASGRTAIVEPVRDNPVVAPLRIPRKSSKRTAVAAKAKVSSPATHATTSTTTTNTNTATPIPNRSSHSTQWHSPLDKTSTPWSPATPSDSETSIATTAPTPTVRTMVPDLLRNRNRKPTPSSTPTTTTNAAATFSASGNGLGQSQVHPIVAVDPGSPQSHAGSNNDKALRRKPPPPNSFAVSSQNQHQHQHQHQHRHAPQDSVSSSVYSVHPSPPAADRDRPHEETDAEPDTWVQPASRFSYTTYATSTNTGSPRDSIDSDLPPMPVQVVESVMERKRPVPSANPASDDPVVITMKTPFATERPTNGKKATTTAPPSSSPTPATTTNTTADGDRGHQSRLSLSKALPPAPPELQSVNDRVAHLNARLQALGNRRININTAIKQMTELMPTDNLLASDAVLRKRDEEKRTVEAFKAELADVQREEYEIGLKLHRAYKRMDQNAEYEPTTLWVRRITG